MNAQTHARCRRGFGIVVALLLAAPALALDKSELELVFQDDFESGHDGWTFSDPENWRVEEEGETGNHVLSLFAPSANERKFFAPRSVALVDDLTAEDFIFEARMQHRGEPYGHQDLCVPFHIESEYQFYYVHIAPVSDDGANSIFLIDNAERKSIAAQRNDGTPWGDGWHDIRIIRDTSAGTIAVFFDDMTTPIMTAQDTTFTHGPLGIGSFNDIGWFDNIKIWTRPEPTEPEPGD